MKTKYLKVLEESLGKLLPKVLGSEDNPLTLGELVRAISMAPITIVSECLLSPTEKVL